MTNTQMNHKTLALLEGYAANPSTALLLVGSNYSNAEKITSSLVKKLLGRELLSNVVVIEQKNGKKIGIDQVRNLRKSLTTKLSPSEGISRVAIIKKADEMTIESQNAVLKIIEEPISGTVIIMQTNKPQMLIATISSRCQRIDILPVSLQQALSIGESQNKSEEEVRVAYKLSKGESELFNELLNKNYSEARSEVIKAKEFFSMTVLERLKEQKTFSKSEKLEDLLNGLELTADAALHSTNSTSLKRWRNALKIIIKSKERLNSNANLKLIYLNLSINL